MFFPPFPILLLRKRKKGKLEIESTRAGEKAKTLQPIPGLYPGTGTITGIGLILRKICIRLSQEKKGKRATLSLNKKIRRGMPKQKSNPYLLPPLLPVQRRVKATPKKGIL